MKYAKFLMTNEKGQNESGQGSGKEKTKRKYEVTIEFRDLAGRFIFPLIKSYNKSNIKNIINNSILYYNTII